MRVAQITKSFLPMIGGQEVYVRSLNTLFDSVGIDWHVYQRVRRKMERTPRVIGVLTIPFIAALAKEWDFHIFNLFLALTQRGHLAHEDCIIAHYAVQAIPVWDWKSKVIVLSHGIEWDIRKRKLESRIREAIARKAFTRFLLVANDTHYLRYFGIPISPGTRFFEEIAPRKWFIPNCVDTSRFVETEPLPDLAGRKIILVPRQITPDRGIDLAILTFALLAKNHPEFEMHIVGSPTRGRFFETCRALAVRVGLERRILFVGHVPYENMPSYFSSAEVTLIPTLRREGTSLSALESMSCGTATVSTNVAGLADLPTIQAEANPIDLSSKLESTLRDREKIAERQKLVTHNVFNMRNWSLAWLRVIEGVKSN